MTIALSFAHVRFRDSKPVRLGLPAVENRARPGRVCAEQGATARPLTPSDAMRTDTRGRVGMSERNKNDAKFMDMDNLQAHLRNKPSEDEVKKYEKQNIC